MSIIKMTHTSNKKSRYFQQLYDYITDEVKSEGLIGARGCPIENAVPSMEMLKKLAHKPGGRQTIEIVVSLTPDTGSISDKSYLGAAENIAGLFPDYQSYYAVHKDSSLRHIHIVMNTINFKTWRKFTQSKSELNRYRHKVNLILEAYGFDIMKESANIIWDGSEHSGTTFSHLEIEESMPPSRRFDMEIQPMAEPLKIKDIFQVDSLDFNTENAVPWYYDGNGEYKNPDYPSIADAAAGAAFGFGRNYDPNSLMFNSSLLANFHNPFEEAFRMPRSQRWNSQQSSILYRNSPYNKRRVPVMYRNQPSMSAPAYFNPPSSAFGGQINHYPYCQENPYSSQPELGTPNMYENQAFSPVPPYPNQPTSDFQNNPYSSYFNCPPNNFPYCQDGSSGSQPEWETQDIYENQPFMPVPTYAEPASLWQPPTQTSYPTDTSYSTFSGNGYAAQYQPDSLSQSMPSFIPQNPYPTIGASIGNVYQINAASSTDPGYLAQFAQELLRYESEQRPTLGANIGWTMGKEAFQQDIPANCYVDASPRIVINLIEQPNQSDDENNTSNMIDTTLTDTE